MKLQKAIQERLSKVDQIKFPVNIGGEKQKEARTRSKELINQLEEEISDLQRKNTELEQLSQTEDHLHFLQVIIERQYTTHQTIKSFIFFC